MANPIIVSIPQEGGVFALGVGETSFDFLTGEIRRTNKELVLMRSSLSMQRLDAMHSLVISTNKTVIVDLRGGNRFQLGAGERISLNGLEYIYLSIAASEATNVRLLATNAAVAISNDPSMMEALGRISESKYDVSENIAQVITLDMGEDYSRNTVEAYGQADADTTFMMEQSDDGVHWFTVDTETGADYHGPFRNAFRFARLSSAATPVVGDKVSLVLVGVR